MAVVAMVVRAAEKVMPSVRATLVVVAVESVAMPLSQARTFLSEPSITEPYVPEAVAVAVADGDAVRPVAVAVVVRVPLLVRADQVNVGTVYLDLFAVAAEVAVAVEEGPEQRPPVQVEEAPAIPGLQQAALGPVPAVVVEPVEREV